MHMSVHVYQFAVHSTILQRPAIIYSYDLIEAQRYFYIDSHFISILSNR